MFLQQFINIWPPGYAAANDQDIALQQNPETLSSISCLEVTPTGDKM